MERDATNNATINRLNNEDDNTWITIVYCTRQGLALVGKKFTLAEGTMCGDKRK
jgi:hypothetical protein